MKKEKKKDPVFTILTAILAFLMVLACATVTITTLADTENLEPSWNDIHNMCYEEGYLDGGYIHIQKTPVAYCAEPYVTVAPVGTTEKGR